VAEHVQSLAPRSRVSRIVQVHEKKVEFSLRQRRKQISGVAHRFEEVALAFEEQLQGVQYILLVIGNEDSLLHRLTMSGSLDYRCGHKFLAQVEAGP